MKPTWYSSYEENNYGELFYSLVRIYQPETVVELGTEAGYSAYHIARGLSVNGKGHLDCYDLWEKYNPQENYGFYSASKSIAEQNLIEFKDIITLNLVNATSVDEKYGEIDILHVDLHNEGEILAKIIPRWIDKTRQFIIIEGGSLERDQIDSMIKYNMVPIRKWLEDFSHSGEIEYFTIEPFPSVTLIRKIT